MILSFPGLRELAFDHGQSHDRTDTKLFAYTVWYAVYVCMHLGTSHVHMGWSEGPCNVDPYTFTFFETKFLLHCSCPMYARPTGPRALGNHPVSTVHLSVEILCYHPGFNDGFGDLNSGLMVS